MKSFLMLFMFISLIACEGTTGTKEVKKSCTYNGEAVSCDELHSTPNEGVDLTARITVAMELRDDSFEVLENAHDIDRKVLNGNEYECAVAASVGQTFHYEVKGNKLILKAVENGRWVSETFIRATEGEGAFGTWRIKVNEDNGGYSLTALNLTEDELTIEVRCHFQ